jgi:Uma2 family endonuclease
MSRTLSPKSIRVPELHDGDRLTRAEFERRYQAMPDLKKAELIEGVVHIMPSPVSHEDHGGPHFNLVGWLAFYRAMTPGTDGGDNSTQRLDFDNEPQPDAFLRILPECGGISTIEEGYIKGPVELSAEVSASSASYDLHDKFKAYRRNGVKEYVVWRVLDEAIDWFVLHEGEYKPLQPTERGTYQSQVFPGLWLDAPALLRGDLPQVFGVLQQGIDSQEHARFVEQLREKKSSAK